MHSSAYQYWPTLQGQMCIKGPKRRYFLCWYLNLPLQFPRHSPVYLQASRCVFSWTKQPVHPKSSKPLIMSKEARKTRAWSATIVEYLELEEGAYRTIHLLKSFCSSYRHLVFTILDVCQLPRNNSTFTLAAKRRNNKNISSMKSGQARASEVYRFVW